MWPVALIVHTIVKTRFNCVGLRDIFITITIMLSRIADKIKKVQIEPIKPKDITI